LTTLLENVQAVADEAGYTVGSSVVGSTDTTSKQLLAIANRINQEMSHAYLWNKMFKSGTITFVSGQAQYALPADFSQYHYDTWWNQSSRWRLLGAMSEQRYADIQGYGLSPTVYDEFQIRGITDSQLLISPTPGSSGDVIIFEYVSDRTIKPKTWQASTAFGTNSYCSYNGNYYTTTAGGTTGGTPPTHTSGSVSDGALTWTYYGGAYTKFLADTDETIFNPKTLEQGMLERFAEIHGLTTIVPRFEVKLNDDYARQKVGKSLFAGSDLRMEVYGRSGRVGFGTPL
jgi:hypothetical protein